MSVLIPVVFFVLDISLPKLAGWGEYVRWVGAAAASVSSFRYPGACIVFSILPHTTHSVNPISTFLVLILVLRHLQVVVWEWVERIEALERDERKDGILGREIFDGDEMLGRSSSDNSDWRGRRGAGGGDVEKSGGFGYHVSAMRTKLPLRRRRKRAQKPSDDTAQPPSDALTRDLSGANTLVPPQPAISPPSRSDTNSAASTVYAVRYHNLSSPSPAQPEPVPEEPSEDQNPKDISDSSTEDPPIMKDSDEAPSAQVGSRGQQFWSTVPKNPFKRRRAEPPAEVAGVEAATGVRRSPIDRTINLRDRLGTFAAAQRDRLGRHGSGPQQPLPVMVIPAPKQNDRTWSPEDVRNSSSISSTGREQGTQAGLSGHSRQASNTSEAGGNVVTIPAPTSGRTWSPQDAVSSSYRAASDTVRDPRTPPGQNDTSQTANNVISTPRGALTINEEPGRSPRRNTYTRRPTQLMTGASASTETQTEEAQIAIPPTATLSPDATQRRLQERTTAPVESSNGKDPAAPAGEETTEPRPSASSSTPPSATQENRSRNAGVSIAMPDGRDTGGTLPGGAANPGG